MNVVQSETRERFPLSFRKIIKKTMAGIFAYVIIIGFLAGLWIFFYSKFNKTVPNVSLLMIEVSAASLVLLILLTYIYQRWYFVTYFYDLTDDYIVIKKGPITPHEITIPYERIQDVYVDQDLFDRIFGLYDVHLSSATAQSGMEAHIDGVDKKGAEGLRDALLKTIQKKMGKQERA